MTFSHEVSDTVEAPYRFPRVQVPRTPAFDGYVGAENLQYSAWLSPNGGIRLEPRLRLFQNAYFENDFIEDSTPATLEPGDRYDFFIASGPYDTVLPWDATRTGGNDDGELHWETATVKRRVTAERGGVEQGFDVLFYRASLVARGGAVDARVAAVEAPPLILPTPVKPELTDQVGANAVKFSPGTEYIGRSEFEHTPGSDQIALTKTPVKGYLPEAQVIDGPGGQVKTWHLTVMGAVYVTKRAVDTGELPRPRMAPMVSLDPGSPGELLSFFDGKTTSTAVGPDDVVLSGDRGTTVARASSDGGEPEAQRDFSPGTRLREVRDAADIVPAATEAVDLTFDEGLRGLRVDPDYAGRGLLAVEKVRHRRRGTRYVELMSVPALRLDGKLIALDRSRLTDLHLVPAGVGSFMTTAFNIQAGTGELQGNRRVETPVTYPGYRLEAVYDVGGGRSAWVKIDHDTYDIQPPEYNFASVSASVETPEGRVVPAAPVIYAKAPPGAVTLGDGTAVASERSVDFGTGGETGRVNVGPVYLTGDTGSGPGRRAQVQILRGDRPFDLDAVADASAELGDGPVAFLITPQPDDPGDGAALVRLYHKAGAAPEPPPPPSITQRCNPLPFTDPAGDTTTEGGDLVSAWLNSDEHFAYPTLEVADLPQAAPLPGSTITYELSWRNSHGVHNFRAVLDSLGAWTFTELDRPAGFSTGFTTQAQGEVDRGSGLIRVPISIEFFRTMLVRDVKATATLTIPALGPQLIDGDSSVWGLGGDWLYGTCGA